MHFAALAYVGESVTAPSQYYDVNVHGTRVLLDAMIRARVPRIVFSSSCAVYGEPAKTPIIESTPTEPVNPYGFTKLVCERMMKDFGKAYGLKSARLRYFNAAGADPTGEIGEDHEPETHLIPLVLDTALGRKSSVQIFGTDYATPDGTAIRDYVHVADLARAHVLALEYLLKGGDSIAINLGSGRGSSVREVIDTARALTGLEIIASRSNGGLAIPQFFLQKQCWPKPCLDGRPSDQNSQLLLLTPGGGMPSVSAIKQKTKITVPHINSKSTAA